MGVACGVGAGAMWGMVFLAPKATPDASPALMAAGRYIAYGLIAAMLVAPRWRRLTALLTGEAWRALVLLSVLGNLLYYALLVVAVHWAGVSASALIVGMVPVVVALWGLREPGAAPLKRIAPALVLAVIAVVLIGHEASQGEAGGEGARPLWTSLMGLGCAVAALVSWSAYAVFNSRWLDRLPDVSAHDWSLLTGVVTGGLSLGLAVLVLFDPPQWAIGDWGLFVGVSAAVAFGASIVGNAFWNRASRLLPMTLMGQMIVFETLFALAYGFLLARRGPSLLEGLAVVLMVASVLLSVRAHGPELEAER
ncbi:DMT family transporter [Brevundimonas goettingensis]|uniref:DMT family transporter n=1 Tax=Brevundimonas goettingensis TaxID=2774190 RepID=A0A975C6A2_9CAUL|nr:DMT family transporter [Brevundimonas goettingensis]